MLVLHHSCLYHSNKEDRARAEGREGREAKTNAFFWFYAIRILLTTHNALLELCHFHLLKKWVRARILVLFFFFLCNCQFWFCSSYGQCIRMANLSLACCHTVNGVSRLHLETLKTRVFKVIWILHYSDFSLFPIISWALDFKPAAMYPFTFTK